MQCRGETGTMVALMQRRLLVVRLVLTDQVSAHAGQLAGAGNIVPAEKLERSTTHHTPVRVLRSPWKLFVTTVRVRPLPSNLAPSHAAS